MESVQPSSPPVKRVGITPGERYLKRLSDKTFLSLWAHPNLFKEPGKELCDLLVVFGNHVIIFSDKDCQFPVTEELSVGWKKWFRRAVTASAHQVWGAERWIRKFPERVFLDAQASKPFPFRLPDHDKIRFHLVVVTHTIARHCSEILGGSGSLMILNDLKGINQHIKPFTVGDLDPERTFVHVLDDMALTTVMKTRDTIFDFIAYLEKKEILLRSNTSVFAAGEEELLALYLKRLNPQGEHDFDFPPDADGIGILEGQWEEFQKHPQRLAQLESDRVSYFWDYLIELFSKHAVEGTQHFASSPALASTEKPLRFLAAQPRYIRRVLAEGFLDIVEKTPKNQRFLRVVPPREPTDPYFVFLLFPFREDRSYEENRHVRKEYLAACCRIVRLKYPDAVDIVGIATESGRNERGGSSEDACYFDARQWTKEDEREARELQSTLEILINPTERPVHVSEYPEPTTIAASLVPIVGRNEKCRCGSGQKYKKCHGK